MITISYASNNTEIIRLAMEFNRQQLTGQEILVIIMYGLVVLVSLFGNLLVCKVILFKRSMRRRTTNVFIANLTISDLLMTVFTIPMFIILLKKIIAYVCLNVTRRFRTSREQSHVTSGLVAATPPRQSSTSSSGPHAAINVLFISNGPHS
ncbi:hypothetical protein TYRP_018505 [Tyrophagus putrescentiae]|nr:hypothetical protein TYRP_018505 [Tyrophagus putrescentiae]